MEAKRIKVLPDPLVNQIAAGEVIERPASVVKELLENAIDAGANHITIEIEGAGLALIRVTDNGHGMEPGDAVLSLQRHATSKIASISDLLAVRTLGFRGEALPSIASVSRFDLVTRTCDADVGVRVIAQAGAISTEPVACPVGTSIRVADLFFNVPARLKFQKGERSQGAAIQEVVERAALAHPELHLVLRQEGRRSVDYLPCEQLSDRAAAVFGKEAAGRLYSFDEQRDGRVSGVLGEPSLARPNSGRLVFLVNGRPVTDAALRRAAIQAYSVLVPAGRFPVAVVRIDIDPSEVDVNVHPQKAEVRFRRHQEVAGMVFSAMSRVITAAPWIGGGAFDVLPGGIDASADALGLRESQETTRDWSPTEVPLFAPKPATCATYAGLRYVGQLGATVLVLEGEDSVIFVDQHAAHERVNFDRLWSALSSGTTARQPLLFPEIVRLSPAEASRLDAALELLGRVGFDCEPYSGDSLAVRAVPLVLKGRAVEPVLRDVLASLAEGGEGTGIERLHKVVSTVACHASVRAGDVLSEEQVRALLASMEGIDLAAYCPHGRQAIVVQPWSTLLRWFGR